MKRVLFFTPRYPPFGGGSAIYSSSLVEELSCRVNFQVITYHHPQKPLCENGDSAVVYRVIPHLSGFPIYLRAIIESLVSFLFAFGISIVRNVDLLHVHAGSYATPGIITSSILLRKEVIYDCRDELFPPDIVRWGNVKSIFSCSSSVDSHLAEAGIENSQIERVPVVNPKYIGEIQQGKSCDEVFRIAFIGRVLPEKGADILFEAFKDFNNEYSDTTLVVVGDDPLDIATRAEDGLASESIQFLGEIPHHDVLQELAKSDVLVLPSESEGLPRVIVEAFELGVPVVSTSVGSIPDLVEDYRTGLLIDQNRESIRNALTVLYHDKDLRSQISQNEMEISQNWDWDAVSRTVLAQYRK